MRHMLTHFSPAEFRRKCARKALGFLWLLQGLSSPMLGAARAKFRAKNSMQTGAGPAHDLESSLLGVSTPGRELSTVDGGFLGHRGPACGSYATWNSLHSVDFSASADHYRWCVS